MGPKGWEVQRRKEMENLHHRWAKSKQEGPLKSGCFQVWTSPHGFIRPLSWTPHFKAPLPGPPSSVLHQQGRKPRTQWDTPIWSLVPLLLSRPYSKDPVFLSCFQDLYQPLLRSCYWCDQAKTQEVASGKMLAWIWSELGLEYWGVNKSKHEAPHNADGAGSGGRGRASFRPRLGALSSQAAGCLCGTPKSMRF